MDSVHGAQGPRADDFTTYGIELVDSTWARSAPREVQSGSTSAAQAALATEHLPHSRPPSGIARGPAKAAGAWAGMGMGWARGWALCPRMMPSPFVGGQRRPLRLPAGTCVLELPRLPLRSHARLCHNCGHNLPPGSSRSLLRHRCESKDGGARLPLPPLQ